MSSRFTKGNSLNVKLSELGDADRVDVILTNPPFGGEEEKGIQGGFPADKQTSWARSRHSWPARREPTPAGGYHGGDGDGF